MAPTSTKTSPKSADEPELDLSKRESASTERNKRKQTSRNEERLLRLNEKDRRTVEGESNLKADKDKRTGGKRGEWGNEGMRANGQTTYLSGTATDFFADPIRGPDDASEPPHWFLEELEKLSKTQTRAPKKPPINFEVGIQAAENNGELLKKHGFDLGKLIDSNKGTTLDYGSEFRPVKTLKPLIGGHPNFEKFAAVLSHGMPYVFVRELDEPTRKSELKTTKNKFKKVNTT